MKKLFQKIQAMLAAASFAEENEVETAKAILAEAGIDASEPERDERPNEAPWTHGAPLAKGTGA